MGAEVRGPSPCHRGDSGTLGGEDSTFAAGEGRLNNDCRSPDRQIWSRWGAGSPTVELW